MDFEQAWVVVIRHSDKGGWEWLIQRYEGEMQHSPVSSDGYSSSSVLFQECMSVLDASIFTSLAIAEGVLPEGQVPLF